MIILKQLWKWWIISEIRNTFCFRLYLENVENGAIFFKTKTMVIGLAAAEFVHHSNLLNTSYPQRYLMTWFLLKKYSRFKIRIFVNLCTDLYFHCHLLPNIHRVYRVNVKKKQHFGENINLYFPAHWIENSLKFGNYLQPFAWSVGSTVQKENGGKPWN